MRRIAACLALLAGALFTPALAAEECTAPCFGYDLSTKMNLDWIIGSHPSDFRSTDFYPSFEGEFWFSPAEHLKLVSHLTTEPVLDKVPGENRYFGDVGTYAEELYALIEFDPLTVRIGKIDAGFSLASDVLSGINSTNLVGNFDTDQSWGGEAAVTFDAMGLPQRLTLDAFTTDRTFLSQSLFTNRGRLRLSEGEAGNTTGLSSFSAILDGCVGADANECYDQGRFGYRLAARYQRAGHRTLELMPAMRGNDRTGEVRPFALVGGPKAAEPVQTEGDLDRVVGMPLGSTARARAIDCRSPRSRRDLR